jgi:twitching motility protein PilT
MSLQGNLRYFEVPDILQLISGSGRTGIMTIRPEGGKSETQLFCREGRIVHAASGERQGEDVIYELFLLEEGSFQFEPVEIRCPETVRGTLENILQEGFKRLGRVADASEVPVSDTPLAEELLRRVMEMGASDLHLNAALPPQVRIHGKLVALDHSLMTPGAIEKIALSLLSPREAEDLHAKGDLETSYGMSGVGRFRISIFRQRGSLSLAARCIPFEHLLFEELGLPESVRTVMEKPNGLILVTGSTGSGKSTTLASMVSYINRTRHCNIITLEDPIEFLHPQEKAIIRQREVGQDTVSFATGLKHVLRQDPDVVLVGEMRDLPTIEGALFAAEAGQLVLATLHTTDAAQSINRIIDIFPSRQQGQIRLVLSMVLQAVITQQLVPRTQGNGRALAAEVLVATSGVRSMIREGKVHQISGLMETGMKEGMRTMNHSLAELVRREAISLEQAFGRSANPEGLRSLL